MRIIIINIIMAFLSLIFIGFAGWTYGQSIYHEKVRKYFYEKPVSEIENLKTLSALTDRIVLLTGNVIASETFTSRKNKKVILERYLEETKKINSKKDWHTEKKSSFFKVLPFKLKGDKTEVLIDTFGLDKTYIGIPEINIITEDKRLRKKSLWIIEPSQNVYILGNVESKANQLVINNPNLYKSFFIPFWKKEPFIITTMSKLEVPNKAIEIGQNLYYVSLALFTVGGFFLISSLSNIIKTYNSLKNSLGFEHDE